LRLLYSCYFPLSLLSAATTGGITITIIFACAPAIENSLGTPHAGFYRYRINRAVPGTSATLHAGVPVVDSSLAFLKRENHVGTYFQTAPAANTFVNIKGQRHYIFKISHRLLLLH
jgi:hypothetical protein